MHNESRPDKELTGEALEVLAGILEETRKLREIDLADIPPASVFEAG